MPGAAAHLQPTPPAPSPQVPPGLFASMPQFASPQFGYLPMMMPMPQQQQPQQQQRGGQPGALQQQQPGGRQQGGKGRGSSGAKAKGKGKRRLQKGLEDHVRRTVYVSYVEQAVSARLAAGNWRPGCCRCRWLLLLPRHARCRGLPARLCPALRPRTHPAPVLWPQVTEEQLAHFFSDCGKIVDCRVCGDPNSAMRFAFIEFTELEFAQVALGKTGARRALPAHCSAPGLPPPPLLPRARARLAPTSAPPGQLPRLPPAPTSPPSRAHLAPRAPPQACCSTARRCACCPPRRPSCL